MNQVKEQLGQILEVLKKNIEKTVVEIPSLKILPCEYKKGQSLPTVDENWQEFKRFDRVQGRDKHFWLYTEIDTPEVSDGKELELKLVTACDGSWDALNPQGMLYLNGEMVCGLDLNHREFPLKPHTHYEIYIYFYVGLISIPVDAFLNITEKDLGIQKLYYDMQVPYEAAECYPPENYINIKILKALEVTAGKLDLRNIGSEAFYESLEKASDYLQKNFYEKECGTSDAVVNYLGHTHIDVAWLWTLAQTREKAQRTFSSMLHLMDVYPDFIFFTSQPQLLKYLKEEAPDVYEKVKKRAAEGRFEIDGAMWLEADCNLCSGESFVRQIMHGKKFMQDEFRVDSQTLWLPDVFGYSAALPQILKKTGVNRFVTSKISWSEENQMPYDTFLWQGIDGTEIFSYFLTAQNHGLASSGARTTYVGTVTPAMNLGTWERYQQKEYNNETVVTCGYGDGGGGTTAEMIEYERRLSYGLPGQPKARFSRASDFLDRVEKNFYENAALLKRAPRWVGELYLEFHRGTYTSIAKNKKNNRQCEFLLENAETLNVLTKQLKNAPYRSEVFYRNWETVLLNQFHDIIPGSSIFEVYEDSDRDYAKVRKEVGQVYQENLKLMAGENPAEKSGSSEKKGTLLYNPNGFSCSAYVKTDGGYTYVENLPSMGLKYVENFPENPAKESPAFRVTDRRIETPFYLVELDESARFTRLYDKENNREVLASGQKGNVLRSFENHPHQHDNWELFRYYEKKSWDITEVTSFKTFTDRESCGYTVEYAYDNSTLQQTVRFYEKSRRIDFETVADWHEDHQILKVLFPVDILAEEATYEIQYGNVKRPTHRNTSWDEAKFEVCAHKWADLSEEGYGVSLLNDCKYGYGIHENVMTLSLIKTGTYPNPVADQGTHSFTYGLLPHRGTYREGNTVQEAYLLNRPVEVLPATEDPLASFREKTVSLACCSAENVLLECAKEKEDQSGDIFRLYECFGKRTEAKVTFLKEAKEIWLCDLMENPIKLLGKGKEVSVPFKNFEIQTLLVRY